MKKGIGISVPAYFSHSFINKLNELQINKTTDNYIDNIYGSPRSLVLGQARASKKIPELTLEELKNYIAELHNIDVKFHFTLNSVWSNGIERDNKSQNIILQDIENIVKTGIDGLIIGNLYLAELITKHFGNINKICSINLKTNSVYKLKSLLTEFGFDKVVLERTVNRNIRFLQNLRGIYNENVVLLANPDCIYDCPLSLYHMLENGHVSITKDEFSDKNYCTNYCEKKYMNSYTEILKTPWIHPSDLDLYENIGLKFLKIQGRTLPEEKILHLTELYLNRLKSDNFVEIFPNFIGQKRNEQKFNIFHKSNFNQRAFIETFFKNKINCNEICNVKCKKCDNWIVELEKRAKK